MLVRRGEHTDLEAPATAKPTDDVVWRDYYTRLPQIRLTGDSAPSEPATEITLDGNDVGKLPLRANGRGIDRQQIGVGRAHAAGL